MLSLQARMHERLRSYKELIACMAMLAAVLVVGSGCRVEETPSLIVYAGETMGTTYTVKLIAPPEPDNPIRQLVDTGNLSGLIEQRLDEVNSKMSTYRKDSELSRFNTSESTEPFPVSAETAQVLAVAQEVSRASDGAFDITVGPLVNAWGFGPGRHQEPPDEETLTGLLERVGYELVSVDSSTSTLQKSRPDVYCDLSAVAKGYAVDRVADALEEKGVKDYLVEVGGEIRGAGHKATGEAWRVAVEKPLKDRREAARVLPLSGEAMASSGDYRNFYEKDGQVYSHTIDPRVGRPIMHKLAAVSVIHDKCVYADAYATAIMVLGPQKGLAWAREQGLRALLLVHDDAGGFDEVSTPAFDGWLETAQQEVEVNP